MDITKLIYQVEQGDVKAEKELYDYCYRHCFKIAAIYCKDKNTAISVFNHTMIAVFGKLSSLTQPKGLVSYVNRVDPSGNSQEISIRSYNFVSDKEVGLYGALNYHFYVTPTVSFGIHVAVENGGNILSKLGLAVGYRF